VTDPTAGGESGDATGVPEEAEAVDAALDAVEPERLLSGERVDTPYLDDAEHWVTVYRELLDFKRSLLAVAQEHVASMDKTAVCEVEKTDMKILKAEAERFERRLEFWRDRARRLAEPSSNP